jgi:hypothetical protein
LNKKEKLNLTREDEQDLSSWNKAHQLNVTEAAEQDKKNWTKKRSWTWIEKLNKIWALEQRQSAETD